LTSQHDSQSKEKPTHNWYLSNSDEGIVCEFCGRSRNKCLDELAKYDHQVDILIGKGQHEAIANLLREKFPCLTEHERIIRDIIT
jgi:hypothetical protein